MTRIARSVGTGSEVAELQRILAKRTRQRDGLRKALRSVVTERNQLRMLVAELKAGR